MLNFCTIITGNISRRAHRVLITGKREADNVEDKEYTNKVNLYLIKCKPIFIYII